MMSLVFPGGEIIDEEISATAGDQDAYITIGNRKRARLIFGHITLTCDGTVANRVIRLSVDDGVDLLTRFLYSPSITASQTKTVNYNDAQESEGSFSGHNYNLSLGPNVILDAGDRIKIEIDGGVAGDSYSGVFRFLQFGL